MSDSFGTLWAIAWQAPLSMGFSSNNNGVSCHALLLEIFPTQGSNLHHLCLLHYGLVLIIPFYSPLFYKKKSMFLKTNEHTVVLYYRDCLVILIPLEFSLLPLLMSSLLYLSSKLLVLHYSFSMFIYCFILLFFFILFMGFSGQECWTGLPFPSQVDYVLPELTTMTCLSWVGLHSMAHSFIELDKVVIHVISLFSFLWLWFSFCLTSDGWG